MRDDLRPGSFELLTPKEKHFVKLLKPFYKVHFYGAALLRWSAIHLLPALLLISLGYLYNVVRRPSPAPQCLQGSSLAPGNICYRGKLTTVNGAILEEMKNDN